jgi:ABC-type multidrug transport system fused ATPase/permease subunit
MSGLTLPENRILLKLNFALAQLVIVAGLVLVLTAPLIPVFKTARVARAQTELNQMDTLVQLELDDLKRSQDRERKEDAEAAERDNSTPLNYALGAEEVRKQQQQRLANQQKRQERESERRKAFEDKQEELRQKYDANARKRALVEAQVAASGMRWHRVLSVLGYFLLLIGLLAITLESDGMRQKVALIILLVVLLSALSGVSLVVAGSLGDRSVGAEQLVRP